MYFPYFRGKQYELIALRECATILSNSQIYPIIEPVKNNFSSIERCLTELMENEVYFTLITNPLVGELRHNSFSIYDEIIEGTLKGYAEYSIGYIVDDETTLKDVERLINDYNQIDISIIHNGFPKPKKLKRIVNNADNIKDHIFIEGHSGKLYQKHFKYKGVDRVLLRDGFRKVKNALYPDDEHFSDLHVTYEDEGMNGFGDYLIVGDEFSETGGPAYAVALHLTYIDEDDDMRIKHFKSDRTDTPTDPAGKFYEALEKLVIEINDPSSMVFMSSACDEFLYLYNKPHFPGLGYIKKLSMIHHIELLAKFLKNEE